MNIVIVSAATVIAVLSDDTLTASPEPGYISMRLPQDIVIHYNSYNDDDLGKKIEEFDNRNHKRSPISPLQQRHVDKYGILEKCTWSENVCRQLSLPERENFAEYLNSKGIKLIASNIVRYN